MFNCHFEDDEVLATIEGTQYLKANIARHLQHMTKGEKWSLYRAIVILASNPPHPVLDLDKEPELIKLFRTVPKGECKHKLPDGRSTWLAGMDSCCLLCGARD